MFHFKGEDSGERCEEDGRMDGRPTIGDNGGEIQSCKRLIGFQPYMKRSYNLNVSSPSTVYVKGPQPQHVEKIEKLLDQRFRLS